MPNDFGVDGNATADRILAVGGSITFGSTKRVLDHVAVGAASRWVATTVLSA